MFQQPAFRQAHHRSILAISGSTLRSNAAAIATALECSLNDLTSTPAPATVDRDLLAAHACVPTIRQALVELDRPGAADGPAWPAERLAREAALVRDLWQRCDYAGAAGRLSDLIRAVRAAGPNDERALRLLCDVTGIASSMLRNLEYPADAWLAAQRCHNLAAAIGDPVLLGYAAFGQSRAARQCGSVATCLEAARRAADDLQPHLSRPGAMELLGMLYLTCAAAAHELGRSEDAAAGIAAADQLAAQVGETGTFGLSFGPVNVNLWRVGIDANGGDATRAVALGQTINHHRPDSADTALRSLTERLSPI